MSWNGFRPKRHEVQTRYFDEALGKNNVYIICSNYADGIKTNIKLYDQPG